MDTSKNFIEMFNDTSGRSFKVIYSDGAANHQTIKRIGDRLYWSEENKDANIREDLINARFVKDRIATITESKLEEILKQYFWEGNQEAMEQIGNIKSELEFK